MVFDKKWVEVYGTRLVKINDNRLGWTKGPKEVVRKERAKRNEDGEKKSKREEGREGRMG